MLHRFVSNLHRFLYALNHDLYGKTKGLERFRLFRKSMKNRRFWHQFWHHFGAFWHIFSLLFRHRFLDAFLDAIFSIFDGKWLPEWVVIESRQSLCRAPSRSENAPQTHPRRNLDFSSILDPFWEPFWWYFDGFGMLFWSFSAPVSPLSADFLLSIALLQVASVFGDFQRFPNYMRGGGNAALPR